MVTFHDRPLSIVVLLACALHVAWALTLISDQSALGAVGLSALHTIISPIVWLEAILAVSAVTAILGMLIRAGWLITVLLMAPQQALLYMSAAGAFEATWLGQYADGVLRSHAFIGTDQMLSMLFAIAHTGAIVAHALRASR